ncbi:hypothetical protein CMQ_168 [Grosmannia clavigera kw1407]|uniref:Uncharacterized protein n=1 Tax=Grosmannia clavigera (strain kw1407 / UAMH 11150) TaxID=655863 RepID=F0XQQ9_GROCL|nr:uncharacterized protein CMQ_168 [Grosmannia clavigera kw1407]EFW99850.1 hypothetical protein CMQ_168 [Grosmannia clavigera kw1407]
MSNQTTATSADLRTSLSSEIASTKLQAPSPDTVAHSTEPYADLRAALVAARDFLSGNVCLHANLAVFLIEASSSTLENVTSAAKNNNDALSHIAAAIAMLPDPRGQTIV